MGLLAATSAVGIALVLEIVALVLGVVAFAIKGEISGIGVALLAIVLMLVR